MPRKIKPYTNPFMKVKAPSETLASKRSPSIQDAVTFHQQGQLGQAQSIYNQIVANNPRNADALHLLGVIAYQTGNHQVAADLISNAIEVNPNVASYYSNLGIALKELKQLDAAVASYDKAISLKPDFAEAYSNRGVALQELKKFDAALASYDIATEINSTYAEAHYNRGNSLKELHKFDAAVDSYDKAIKLNHRYAEAYSNRGVALQELELLDAAIASFNMAISINSSYTEAYYNRGVVEQELKKFEASVASYDMAITLKPDHIEAYFNRANALKDLNQFEAAVASYNKALRLMPFYSEAHSNRGVALIELNRFDEAVNSFEQAISLKPDYAEAYSNLGNALKELKQLDAAISSCNQAIALKPDFAMAYLNRGNALKEQMKFSDALASYDKAISLNLGYAEAYSNRGNVYKEIKQLETAVANYDQAIALKPDFSMAYSNRGVALQELKKLDAAIKSYNKALDLNPNFAKAYANLGNAFSEARQFEDALKSYESVSYLDSNYDYLTGIKQHLRMYMCDWQDFDNRVLELSNKIKSNAKASTCLPVLALPIGLAEQRQAAEIWSADKYPFNPSLGPIPKAKKNSKICIGYYSADFRLHPVSTLIVGLFEHHDKAKFELIAFSFGPDTQDEIRGRITNAFDKFIDVRAKSDREVAALSRTLGVDIAIDLGGHTQDCRTGIFAFRAAPIQLSYIGYLGTMGASYYDYLIADQTLIPQEYQTFYSEKIVYLPFYQVNDSQQKIPGIALSREVLNLPKNSFVYCCFNSNYKITPSTFDGWMRILQAVPNSVLLLYTDIQSAEHNLRLEAQKRGVNPERLIFGGRLPRSEYLARCKSADLFLDTLPYNAGATASDALWAGLPVLTCMGESFASRYAASLLKAIELPELVTKSQAEYEALAIELAMNPIKLKEIKEKLEHNRLTTMLFDTALFTKHIETAYAKMHERYLNDLPLDNLYINSK